MKLTDPKIKISNHVGQIRARSFPEAGGLSTAHIAYKEGAEAMASMFREAIQSGDLNRVIDLAKATEKTSFYEY
jgi:hypothetical protein